jgi:hypothetical protein
VCFTFRFMPLNRRMCRFQRLPGTVTLYTSPSIPKFQYIPLSKVACLYLWHTVKM